MNKSRMILKISGNDIFYTKEDKISFSDTNLPWQTFNVKTNNDYYWEVEILSIFKLTVILEIEIIDYYSDKIKNFNNQVSQRKLQKINFHLPIYHHLEKIFSNCQPSAFNDIVLGVYNENKRKEETLSNDVRFEDSKEDVTNMETGGRHWIEESYEYAYDSEELEDFFERIDFKVKVYFKDTTFLDGKIRVSKKVSQIEEKVILEIGNEEIKKEFDLVKFYFPKIFKNKQYTIEGVIDITGNEYEIIEVKSKDIDRINSGMIDEIKQQQIFDIPKLTSNVDEEKRLFTIEDIFREINDKDNSNIFDLSESDIINTLIQNPSIRNRKQLEFLSGFKQTSKSEIKFSYNPNFGFLFTIMGEIKNHYCWELLNSHATYLWSLDTGSDFEEEINRIEETICLIGEIGRKKYKGGVKNDNLDSELNFNIITHSSKNKSSQDGFIIWKNNLLGLLK